MTIIIRGRYEAVHGMARSNKMCLWFAGRAQPDPVAMLWRCLTELISPEINRTLTRPSNAHNSVMSSNGCPSSNFRHDTTGWFATWKQAHAHTHPDHHTALAPGIWSLVAGGKHASMVTEAITGEMQKGTMETTRWWQQPLLLTFERCVGVCSRLCDGI